MLIADPQCEECFPLQAGNYFWLQINDALPSNLPRPHSTRNHHNSHSRNHPDGHSPKPDKDVVEIVHIVHVIVVIRIVIIVVLMF